jgi:hypothetical protein
MSRFLVAIFEDMMLKVVLFVQFMSHMYHKCPIFIRTIWGQTLKMDQILEGVKNKGNNPQITQIPQILEIPYIYHLVICEIFEICG